MDAPVRSMSGRTKFMRTSGCRHTIERVRVTMPAARRVRLKNHQLSINFLDGILDGLCIRMVVDLVSTPK